MLEKQAHFTIIFCLYILKRDCSRNDNTVYSVLKEIIVKFLIFKVKFLSTMFY